MKTLTRLRDKDEILERLQAVTPQSARRWGRMSVHGMVCHLHDAFRMAIGQQPVELVGGVLQHTVIKWIALYAPLQWPGAKFGTSPEIEQGIGGTAPKEFAADIERLEAMLHRVTAEPRAFEWTPHPFFGRMSDADWMRWSYLHVDHHLRQFGA